MDKYLIFQGPTPTNKANEISTQAVKANLIYCVFCENSSRVMQGMHVYMCVFVCLPCLLCEAACKQTPMSSWALGSSTTPLQKGEELLTSTHTHPQTKYACTNKRYIATHRHTNIHKHTDPLDSTLSHKHISLSSHRRQTLPCLLPRRKLSQEGARDQHLSFSLSLSSKLFLIFRTSLHQHFS